MPFLPGYDECMARAQAKNMTVAQLLQASLGEA
jgi:hypothetical protein